MSKGLKANEWIGSISQLLGGKGGGKEDSAQGSAPGSNSISEALNAAKAFAELKLK
jgi:alanyl-tRNA synthetase